MRQKLVNNWWNAQCAEAIQRHKESVRIYKRNKDYTTFIDMKRATAVAKRVLKQNKITSWRPYCNSLNIITPIKAILNHIDQYKLHVYKLKTVIVLKTENGTKNL